MQGRKSSKMRWSCNQWFWSWRGRREVSQHELDVISYHVRRQQLSISKIRWGEVFEARQLSDILQGY